jgi:hypothetical protein
MAPNFLRGYGGSNTGRGSLVEGPVNDTSEGSAMMDEPSVEHSLSPSTKKERAASVFDRRRRRMKATESKGLLKDGNDMDKDEKRRSRQRLKSKVSKPEFDDDDVDPYDSDPGQSYREHCMNMKGMSTRTCMPVPTFLRSPKIKAEESETVLTAPPSPMASEMGDIFGQVPASLPTTLSRVRYSLRSSITDGAEKQPSGPSVMDRRELRPNDVHINVSHWSDAGGRPYMEDR